MTSVAGNTSFHQTTNSTTNTPVYVPSNRAIPQYAGHAGNYANAQNGWPADGAFGECHFVRNFYFFKKCVIFFIN
jgi:hypothetical protein